MRSFLQSSSLKLRRFGAVVLMGVISLGGLARAEDLRVRMEFLDPVSETESLIRSFVSINGEGLVTWSEPGSEIRRQARISSDDRSAVIEELLETHSLEQIHSRLMWNDIEQEARRIGLSPEIQGAGITRIIVSRGGGDAASTRETIIECPACPLLATRYPQVESLQRFAQCQQVLENLRAVMQVGGFDAARELARQANSHLGEQGRSDGPFTCRHLQFVRELPGGARFITFCCGSPDACNLCGTVEADGTVAFQLAE